MLEGVSEPRRGGIKAPYPQGGSYAHLYRCRRSFVSLSASHVASRLELAVEVPRCPPMMLGRRPLDNRLQGRLAFASARAPQPWRIPESFPHRDSVEAALARMVADHRALLPTAGFRLLG